MNKKSFCLLIISCFVWTLTAQATEKVDASGTAAQVNSSATAQGTGATKELDTSGQKDKEGLLGPKTKAKIETMKAFAAEVKSGVEAGQEAYADASTSVGEIKDNYEQQMEDFQKTEAGSAISLKKEYNALGQQMEDRKAVLAEELSAKNKAAAENLNVLQNMYNSAQNEEDKQKLEPAIAEAQNQIAEYAENQKDLQKEDSTLLANDTDYKSLKEQQQQIASQLQEVAMEAAALAGNYIKNMLKKDDKAKQAEYNDVIKKNFLLPEQTENTENVNKIVKYRQEILVKDIAHAFYTAAALKLGLDQNLDKSEQYESNIAAVDYKLTAGNMLIQQKIEDIQNLYNFTNLTMAEMRLKTSQNMAAQDYRLKNYDKNPAVLNLDNYIFTEKDIPTDSGKKSFLDKVTSKLK